MNRHETALMWIQATPVVKWRARAGVVTANVKRRPAPGAFLAPAPTARPRFAHRLSPSCGRPHRLPRWWMESENPDGDEEGKRAAAGLLDQQQQPSKLEEGQTDKAVTVPPERRPNIALIPAKRPVITTGIIATNILMYMAEVYFEIEGRLSGAKANVLFAFGAKINEAIAAGQLWRLVTPIFLHGGLLHLLSNTYALYVISYECEMAYGPLAFSAIYLASGVWGNLFSYWFTPYLSVGASSSIFGLFSAYIVYLLNNYSILGRQARRQVTILIALVIFNFAFGSAPGDAIDNSAHLGGAIGGALLSELVLPELLLRDRDGKTVESPTREDVERQLRDGGSIDVKRKPAPTVLGFGVMFSLLAALAAVLRASPYENVGGGML